MKRIYNARHFLQVTVIQNTTNSNSGILFSVYGPPRRDETLRGPLYVNVFASSTSSHLLAADQVYFENILNDERIMYLKLSDTFTAAQEGYTIIEISHCIGNQST